MTEPNESNDKESHSTYLEAIQFQLNDIEISALACGKKEDQPILLLHGYLDNAASFTPLMEHFQLLPNKRLIAIDLVGHGYSTHRSAGAHYHFLDYVSDLVELFSVNGWQDINIVGHSMGAMIASAFAAAFPENVKSLTLIDSFGFLYLPEEQTTEQLRKGLLSRFKKSNSAHSIKLGSPPKAAKLTRQFTQSSAIKARKLVSDLSDENTKRIVQRSLIKVVASSKSESDLYRWRSDPRLSHISPYRLTLKQGQQLYSDIKCPIQLIYGDKGMAMVALGLKDFSSQVKQLITHRLEGGHHVHMEQPKAIAVLIEQFVTKV